MKAVRLIIFLLLIVLVASCTKGNANPPNNGNSNDPDDNEYIIKTLEGFPIDILPLYKVIRVNSNGYTVREDKNYTIGKDLYTIDFESEADLDEISEFYQDHVDEIIEDSFYDDYTFSALIDGKQANFFISKNESDRAVGNQVTISIGVDPSDYSDQNKYFDEYPDLIDAIEMGHTWYYAYTENYTDNSIRYVIGYFTDIKKEEALSYYRDKYGNEAGFDEMPSGDMSTMMIWNKNGYNMIMYFTEYTNGSQSISVSTEKELKTD